jgi:hypothetical protein
LYTASFFSFPLYRVTTIVGGRRSYDDSVLIGRFHENARCGRDILETFLQYSSNISSRHKSQNGNRLID